MKVQEKIRVLREINHWTQKDIAERMDMSQNGYAKIERGESKLDLEKLEQLANIFNINISELLDTNSGLNYQYGDNNISNYYSLNSNQDLANLQLTIRHKDELLKQKEDLINQKDNEIIMLKKLLAVYEKNS